MFGALTCPGLAQQNRFVRKPLIILKRRCGVTRVATLSVYSLTIAILIISGFSIPTSAQTGSIRLEGTVWDPTGTSLAGALLTAVEESTKRQSDAVSDADGHYVFLSLQPGIYTVTAKSKGFKDVIHRGLSLFQPSSASEDFSFEISAIDKESTPAELTRVNDSATTGALSRKEIEALPTLNRDPLSLLIYQPGVQIRTDAPGYSTVNGTRPGMNNIGLDGISITDPSLPHMDSSLIAISPESISDLQIVTTGGKAEYGRSGGAQFTVTSRMGTKAWSGELYDYFRNKHIDANEFFNNANGISKPALTRNIFGASLSGPILGQKTLLFVNLEGNRTDEQITRNRQVLTDEAKSGMFRWYAPGTNSDTAAYKSFDIIANDPRHLGIDPAVVAILAKIPSPNNNNIGDGLNLAGFKFNNPAYLNRQGGTVRLDHDASNYRLFLRFNYDRIDGTDVSNNADAPFLGTSSGTYEGNNWGLIAGSDWVINAKTINELRVGYLRSGTALNRPARLTTPMLIANSWTNPIYTGFPQSLKSPALEISDYLSQSKDIHTLKYGVSFRRTELNSVDYSGIYPNVTFGRNNGNAPAVGPTGVMAISSANRQIFDNLYNDLLGRIESVSQTYNSSLASSLPAGTAKTRGFTSQVFSAFIQDDWRIRPTFTLNLGLRYEFGGAPKERNGYQSVLDQASQISSSANISNFKLNSCNCWFGKNLKDFAPRAGFAWDVFGSGTMVIRGAYGIYYDQLIGAVSRHVDNNSYGFSQTQSVYPNSAGGDLRLKDGIPLPTQPAAVQLQPPVTRSSSIAVLDPNLRTPRVDQFNLTIEKRIWGAILEAGYVGTRGKRLFQYLNLNQTKTDGNFLQAFKELQAYRLSGTPVPATNSLIRIFGTPLAAMNALGGAVIDSGQAGIAADAMDLNYYSKYAAAGVSNFYIRNFPQFNQFIYGTNSSKSWYNALQLGLRKSGRNYNFRAFYTWSKSLDTISMEGNSFVSAADSLNPLLDKAPSDFDRTHVLNVAWNYALPFGRSRSSDSDRPKWIDAALGGWNIGLLYLRESGARYSVTSGLQNRYSGVASLANFSGDRNIGTLWNNYGTLYWITPDNAKLFTNPAVGEASTSGRNSFIGPQFINLDALLQKKFFFRESKSLQFRIEAFNVLNRTQLGVPNTNLYDSNFGTITATQGNSRKMQVALRYQF
jgi:hypothetical protein